MCITMHIYNQMTVKEENHTFYKDVPLSSLLLQLYGKDIVWQQFLPISPLWIN